MFNCKHVVITVLLIIGITSTSTSYSSILTGDHHEENMYGVDTGYSMSDSNNIYYQSFTSTFDNIVGAEMYMEEYRSNPIPNGSLTISLYDEIGQDAIATGSVLHNSIGWAAVDFGKTVQLDIGSVYYLAATSKLGFYTSIIRTSSYSGGSAFKNATIQTEDMAFRTKYDDNYVPPPVVAPAPAPVPEPATIFLFGLGLLGLAGVSRRKE